MSFHQVAHLAFHSPCCMCVCVCVWMSKHATMRAARLSVQSLWASGGLGEWGRSGDAVWIFCNRGNSVRGAHILTTLSVVFLNVGVQIFLYPSAVSTQLTFLTRFIVFKGFFFPSKANTSTSIWWHYPIRRRSRSPAEMPSLAGSSRLESFW